MQAGVASRGGVLVPTDMANRIVEIPASGDHDPPDPEPASHPHAERQLQAAEGREQRFRFVSG